MRTMKDLDKIRNAIGVVDNTSIKDETAAEDRIITASSDPTEDLISRVSMLVPKNA